MQFTAEIIISMQHEKYTVWRVCFTKQKTNTYRGMLKILDKHKPWFKSKLHIDNTKAANVL